MPEPRVRWPIQDRIVSAGRAGSRSTNDRVAGVCFCYSVKSAEPMRARVSISGEKVDEGKQGKVEEGAAAEAECLPAQSEGKCRNPAETEEVGERKSGGESDALTVG